MFFEPDVFYMIAKISRLTLESWTGLVPPGGRKAAKTVTTTGAVEVTSRGNI